MFLSAYGFCAKPIDVIIPAIEKDLYTLDLAIEGIKKNGVGVRRIIVVSPKKLSSKAEWFNEKEFPFSKEDIATLMQVHSKFHRLGWYYQQLLKIYAPFVIPNLTEQVLILDADTIFLNPTEFINDQAQAYLNIGEEHHAPYHEHAKRLWPSYYKVFPSYSGISNYMVFDKDVLIDLIKEVERQHDQVFWKAFISQIAPKDFDFAGASEYELYFNYVLIRYPNKVNLRPLKWRSVNTLRTMNLFEKHGYDFITSHAYTRM